MISLRYHVVSLVAVFLALGVGILVGTIVLDSVTVSTLEGRLSDLRSSLHDARTNIDDLRHEQEQANAFIEQLGPSAVAGRLAGRRVVIIYDGQNGRWRDSIRDALTQAGAEITGTLTLTDRWKLDVPGAPEELRSHVGATLGAFEPGESPAETALDMLGRRLFDEDGHALLRRLIEKKFLDVAGADVRSAWPADGTLVVAFASDWPKASPVPGWLAALTRGTALVTGTLVASGTPDGGSAVGVLRHAADPPPSLATLDSGEAKFAKIVSVFALESAARGRGGHFGAERGRRLLPEQS